MTGISESGITIKSYDEIVASMEQKFKLEFGDEFDTTPESPDGQNIRIMAAFMADQWILAEQAYHSYNPSVVKGFGLDNLVRLNGVTRIVNTPTRVGLRFDGVESVGEMIFPGTICETADGIQFATTSTVIVPGETMAVCQTLGAIVINPGEVNIIAGEAPADLTVTNDAPGITGVIRETDPQLRARRERSLVRAGTATAEAIYSALADLNLQFVAILENDSDVTVDGVPPHSFNTVVEGGALQDIAQRIYNNKPISIKAFGDNVVQVADSQGYLHPIGISRPTKVPIYVRCRVVRPDNVAINSLRNIRDALVNHVNSLQIASAVEWSKMFGPATAAAPKVNVKTIEISLDGTTWQTADIPMGVVDRAVTDTLKVVVEEI